MAKTQIVRLWFRIPEPKLFFCSWKISIKLYLVVHYMFNNCTFCKCELYNVSIVYCVYVVYVPQILRNNVFIVKQMP